MSMAQAFRCALRERGSTRGSSMALDALRRAAAAVPDVKPPDVGAATAETAGRGLAATLSRERGLHGAACNCYSVCHCFNVRCDACCQWQALGANEQHAVRGWS